MTQFNFSSLSNELLQVEESGLTFAGNSLKWTSAKDVENVTSAIEKCKSLTFLKLEGNTLGVDAAAAIGKALEKHTEFKKALWKDLFTGRLKTEIPQALKHLANGLMIATAQLTVLDCSDNALGPNGMEGLDGLLRSKVCYSLQELRLNNCGLGIYGGRMLSEALLYNHKKSTDAGTPLSLKVFVAGRNRLEDEGAKAISKIFCVIHTFEEITMPQNSIFHNGIAALAEGLKMNTNLRVLNLNDNILTHKGALSLASAIVLMPKLKEINFGDCLLKTNGAYCLAEVLEENHNELEVLTLDSNEIGPEGGLALVSALQNKPNLRLLNLDGNKFGSECCEQIIEMMEETKNPKALVPFDEDESCDEEGEDDDDEEDEDGERHDTTDEVGEDDEQYDDDSCEDDGNAAKYVTALCNESLNQSAEISAQFNTSVSFSVDVSRTQPLEVFFSTTIPSLNMFTDIEETDKLSAFREYLRSYTGENYIILLSFTALKCASLSQSSKEALDVALGLYEDAFTFAEKEKQVMRVMNFFLIQLGLLRCEEKKFKPGYNVNNCRFAFKHALTEIELPVGVRQTLAFFLEQFDK